MAAVEVVEVGGGILIDCWRNVVALSRVGSEYVDLISDGDSSQNSRPNKWNA